MVCYKLLKYKLLLTFIFCKDFKIPPMRLRKDEKKHYTIEIQQNNITYKAWNDIINNPRFNLKHRQNSNCSQNGCSMNYAESIMTKRIK